MSTPPTERPASNRAEGAGRPRVCGYGTALNLPAARECAVSVGDTPLERLNPPTRAPREALNGAQFVRQRL
jgi:hypothetical protein